MTTQIRMLPEPNSWQGLLIVDGEALPKIRVYPQENGNFCLSLDNRFVSYEMDRPELNRWAWFLANAMAVARGYSCHDPIHATLLERLEP